MVLHVCVCLCVLGLMHLNTLLHRSLLHSRLRIFPCIFLQYSETRQKANQPANGNFNREKVENVERCWRKQMRHAKLWNFNRKKFEKVVHLSCSHWGQSWQVLRAALPWLQQSHLPHQAPAHHREEDKATMKKKKKNQK